MLNRNIVDNFGVKKIIKFNPNDVFDLKNIKGEKWKDVYGYNSIYKISNYGRVKGKQILKVRLNKDGHFTVDFYSKNSYKPKRYLVHRLVAIAFIPNKENKKIVIHKNKIKTDNREVNLCWSTGSMKDMCGTNNHRSVKILQYDLKGKLIKEWESLKQIKDELGFSVKNITLTCKGEQKKSNEFIWKYKQNYNLKKIKI